MAQARVPVCFMFIREHMSRMELQALGCLPHQQSERPVCFLSLPLHRRVKQPCHGVTGEAVVCEVPAVARDLVAIRNF